MRPTLIWLPISHYSKKAAWAMTHAGIRFDVRDVWFKALTDFEHVNPASTVPVLEADGELWCGSHHIVAWADRMAEADLYPSAEVREHERWCDDVLGPWAQRAAYRTLYRRPWKYGRNPAYWLAGLAGKPLILNILKHYKARRFETMDAAEGAGRLTRAAERLRDGRPYLFGDVPTAADFAQAALLEPILRARDTLPDHLDRGLLWQHVKRVRPRRLLIGKRRRASKADHARWASLPKIKEEQGKRKREQSEA